MSISTELKITHHCTISQKQIKELDILSMDLCALKNYISNNLYDNPFITSNYNEEKAVEEHAIRSYNDKSLQEHLETQFFSLQLSDVELRIAHYITDLLDTAGYITQSACSIAKELRCETEKIESVVSRLKTLDPTGVYSFTLKDCLETQLKELNIYDDKYTIILNRLDLVAAKNYKALVKILCITESSVEYLCKQIKMLYPKPGLKFQKNSQQDLIIPEAIIKIDNNDIQIEMRYHGLVELVKYDINTLDERQLQQATAAQFFVSAYTRRFNTMRSIISAISLIQKDFLIHGPQYIKPMTLSTIAKILNLHESTISRACNKYIDTPYGIIQLKKLFSSRIESTIYENAYSAAAIKSMIKDMILHEPTTLSDQDITKRLNGLGISVSRRTVNKYRNALKISNSSARKA